MKAYSASGTSAASNSLDVTTPLLAPTDLSATTISTTEIDLAWTINSQNNSGVSLKRSTDGTHWTTISLDPDTTNYQDTALTEGTTYIYEVQNTANDPTLDSAFTPTSSATTLPAAPSGVSGTAASDSQINVTWTNNSGGATGFTIEHSTDGTHWTSAGTVDGSTTTFNDTGLSELTAYFYRVEATDAGGASSWATSGSSTTTLPAAPSNLQLAATTATKITLTWTDNSHGATGYQVWRSVNGGAYSQFGATLSFTATSATDSTVVEATTYSYEIRTISNSLNSLFCSSQSITTIPAKPTTALPPRSFPQPRST